MDNSNVWLPQTTPLGYCAVTVTIGQALDPEFDRYDTIEPDGADIYVVRNGETPIYVGMTERGCMYRLSGHVYGSHSSGPSQVGQCITEHAPESLSWQFDMVDHRDLGEFVKRELPPRDRFGTATAEKALIRALRPLLNVSHHPAPVQCAGNKLDLRDAATDKIPLRISRRRDTA